MRRKLLFKTFIVAFVMFLVPIAARAACPALPTTISNGQVTDATGIMSDLNSVLNCASAGVAQSGTPTTGSLAKFVSPTTVGSGDLSGAVTTSNSLVATLANSGVTTGSYTCPSLTFDAKGRATAATSGTCSGGNSVPTLVQSAGVRGTSNAQGSFTATLGATPATGDLLISILTGFYDNSNLHCPSGFSNTYSILINNDGILVCARIVQAGDGKSYTGTVSEVNGGETFLVLDFLGAKHVQASSAILPTSASSLTFLGLPPSGTSFMIGIATFAPAVTYSSMSNATLLFDGTANNGGSVNHPAVIFRIPAINVVTINYNSPPNAGPVVEFFSISG